MVRAVNSAIDSGELKSGDVPSLLVALDQFDQVFSVLQDDDAAQMQRIYEWAKAEGREKNISPELEEIVRSAALTDAQIDAQIGQMAEARKARDFATSDRIRAELIALGIIIEQTKEGTRWRRK
jgi:cysteinyl-tRNA synthetase